MSIEQEVERLRNEMNTLLGVVRAMPGGIQVMGNIQRLQGGTEYDGGIFVPLQAPLTSGDWSADTFSDTAKTLIDLSAVFGVPAGVKAVLAQVQIRDANSASFRAYLILSPNNSAGSGIYTEATGLANDGWTAHAFACPCNADGDIYYQIEASGAGTLDATIQIWGYWL